MHSHWQCCLPYLSQIKHMPNTTALAGFHHLTESKKQGNNLPYYENMKGTEKFNAVTWIRQDDTTINIGTINQFPAATQSNKSASDNEKFSMSWDTVNSLFQNRHEVRSSNLNSDQLKVFGALFPENIPQNNVEYLQKVHHTIQQSILSFIKAKQQFFRISWSPFSFSTV